MDKVEKFYNMPDLAEGSTMCLNCRRIIVILRIDGKNVMPKQIGPNLYCKSCSPLKDYRELVNRKINI